MKEFLRYFITQIWSLIGLALCMYVIWYPVAENKPLPFKTQIICICIAAVCTIIYIPMVKWLRRKEGIDESL